MSTALALAILVAVGIAGALWGRSAWNKVQLLYWQARCMSFESRGGETTTPVAWARFHRLANGSGVGCDGNAFLHERASGRGRRLLVVDVHARGSGRVLIARTFIPGTLFSSPREVGFSGNAVLDLPGDADIHRGRADPTDASHFTIQYDLAGISHVIDGWLTDDDTVLLEARRPLASVTASP